MSRYSDKHQAPAPPCAGTEDGRPCTQPGAKLVKSIQLGLHWLCMDHYRGQPGHG